MLCLSVDTGNRHLAIVVIEVNVTNKTADILYNSVIRIESGDMSTIHDTTLKELSFLYDSYNIELTTIEEQQKGTNCRIYSHNFYNTNVQGIAFAAAYLKGSKTFIVKPQQWHLLLNGKKKGLRIYRSLQYKYQILG